MAAYFLPYLGKIFSGFRFFSPPKTGFRGEKIDGPTKIFVFRVENTPMPKKNRPENPFFRRVSGFVPPHAKRPNMHGKTKLYGKLFFGCYY